MQALIELLAGFIALLAITALAQFGVNLDSSARAEPEVHRVSDCQSERGNNILVVRPSREC
ncbi:MAG: hypothetical protein V4701_04120 [Pseudomonadota bacterium]